jgi:spore germination protein GerM
MSTRTRAVLALLLVALVGAIAACGIPKDSQPRLIAEPPAGFNTSTQPTTDVGGQTVDVYLIDSKAAQPRLARRKRATTQVAGPREAVEALLDGVTKQDDANGYQTKIPQDTKLQDDSHVQGDVMTIDLSSQISTIAGPPAAQAYAQLVYTATRYGPTKVQFQIEGKPIKVQTDGETKDTVSRSDYRSLDPKS